MAETGKESLDGGVEGPGRRHEPWLWCLLADAPPLQAFTRDAPQLGQEVSLLPLSDAVLRDAEISLGSRAGKWGQAWDARRLGPSWVLPEGSLTMTRRQAHSLKSPSDGNSGIHTAASTALISA